MEEGKLQSSDNTALFPPDSPDDTRSTTLLERYRYFFPPAIIAFIAFMPVLHWLVGEIPNWLSYTLGVIVLMLGFLFIFSFIPLISHFFKTMDRQHIPSDEVEFQPANAEPDLEGLDEIELENFDE